MKYWQKLYTVTLLLFVICLFGGLAAFAQNSIEKSFAARKDGFLFTQKTVEESLLADLNAVDARGKDAVVSLAESYAARLSRQEYQLEVCKNGVLLAGQTTPQGMQMPEPGYRVWQVVETEGNHWITASSAPAGRLEGYRITLSMNMEDFYVEWERTRGRLFLSAGLLTAAFAAGLLLLVRKLNRPIRKLEQLASAYAEGDYERRNPGMAGRKDELGDLTKTLHLMADRIDDQMHRLEKDAEMKQTLIDNVSHEIRTPLTAIRGYSQYIRQADPQGEDLHHAVDVIQKESDRLLKLSEQLLTLSILQHKEVTMQPVSLADMLDFVRETVHPKAAAKDVQIRQEVQDTTIQGEATLLESLFINLLDNAVKACGQGGEVSVRGKREGGRYILQVIDNGSGMDAQTLEQIGQPFFRADKARSRKDGGSGLGVSICRQIASVHHMDMTYQSRPGAGTTVTLTFTAPQQNGDDCAMPGSYPLLKDAGNP